jgi:hypothetical protein
VAEDVFADGYEDEQDVRVDGPTDMLGIYDYLSKV